MASMTIAIQIYIHTLMATMTIAMNTQKPTRYQTYLAERIDVVGLEKKKVVDNMKSTNITQNDNNLKEANTTSRQRIKMTNEDI